MNRTNRKSLERALGEESIVERQAQGYFKIWLGHLLYLPDSSIEVIEST